jgi:uncharacterized lipoprotein NlpE involved in copper resistance
MKKTNTIILIASCALIPFIMAGCTNSEQPQSNYTENEPYFGYNDNIDQNCSDIRRKVYVGTHDPDKLDRDGDGWGCESYGD